MYLTIFGIQISIYLCLQRYSKHIIIQVQAANFLNKVDVLNIIKRGGKK